MSYENNIIMSKFSSVRDKLSVSAEFFANQTSNISNVMGLFIDLYDWDNDDTIVDEEIDSPLDTLYKLSHSRSQEWYPSKVFTSDKGDQYTVSQSDDGYALSIQEYEGDNWDNFCLILNFLDDTLDHVVNMDDFIQSGVPLSHLYYVQTYILDWIEFDSDGNYVLPNHQPINLSGLLPFKYLHDALPLSFTLDEGRVISLDAHEGDIIFTTTEDGLRVNKTFISDCLTNPYKLNDLTDISGEVTYTTADIVELLGDNYAANFMLATANQMMIEGNYSSSDFFSTVQSVLGIVRSEASHMYDLIVQNLSTGNPFGFLTLVKQIVKGVSKFIVTEDKISFSSVDYTIRTSYFSMLPDMVLTAVSMAAMFISPVVGAIVSIGSLGVRTLVNFLANNEEWEINESSTTTQFGVPIGQYRASMEYVYDFLFSDASNSYSKIIQDLYDYPMVKIKAPMVDSYLWIDDEEHLCVESFVTLDRDTLPKSESGTYIIAPNGSFITYGLDVGSMWDTLTYGVNDFPTDVKDKDLFNRLSVGVSMFLRMVGTPPSGGLWASGTVSMSDMNTSWADVVNWAISGTGYSSSNLVTLVNDYIPAIRNSRGNTILYLIAVLSWATDSHYGNGSVVYKVTNRIDEPKFYPPKYSKGSAVKTFLLTVGIVVTGYLAFRATKRFISGKIANRAYKRQAALQQATESFKLNPTTANYNKMYRASRKYRRVSSNLAPFSILPTAAANVATATSLSLLTSSIESFSSSDELGLVTLQDILNKIVS